MTFGTGTTQMVIVGQVLARMARLDETGSPEGIAELLRGRVRGVPKLPDACPVHRHITGDMWFYRGEYELSVGQHSTEIQFPAAHEGHEPPRLCIDTPANLAAFVREFDRYMYPALIDYSAKHASYCECHACKAPAVSLSKAVSLIKAYVCPMAHDPAYA